VAIRIQRGSESFYNYNIFQQLFLFSVPLFTGKTMRPFPRALCYGSPNIQSVYITRPWPCLHLLSFFFTFHFIFDTLIKEMTVCKSQVSTVKGYCFYFPYGKREREIWIKTDKKNQNKRPDTRDSPDCTLSLFGLHSWAAQAMESSGNVNLLG